LELGISVHLSGVCFTEAENANALFRFREAQHMQPIAKSAKRNVPDFTVLTSLVSVNNRGLEFEARSLFERQASFSYVARILLGIEADAHPRSVCTI
jgi:hypothetical protein